MSASTYPARAFRTGTPVPQPMSPAKCGKLTINGVQRKTGVRLHPAGQCPARIYALILRSRNQESGYFGLARYRHLARTDLDIGKCCAVTHDLSQGRNKPPATGLLDDVDIQMGDVPVNR
jgi:hypothetical protein